MTQYRRGELGESDIDPSWYEQLRAWFRRGRQDAPAIVEPNAIQLATVGRERPPVRPDRAGQDAGRARHRLLHQLRLGQGRRSDRQPVRGGGVRLARARAAGAAVAGRSSGSAGPRPRPTSPRVRADRSWARGPRRSRAVVASRAELEAQVRRRSRPASATGRCRRRRTGAATCCARSRSSSGRAGPIGCTTGCGSGRADRLDSSGWPVTRAAGAPLTPMMAAAPDRRVAAPPRRPTLDPGPASGLPAAADRAGHRVHRLDADPGRGAGAGL